MNTIFSTINTFFQLKDDKRLILVN